MSALLGLYAFGSAVFAFGFWIPFARSLSLRQIRREGMDEPTRGEEIAVLALWPLLACFALIRELVRLVRRCR